MLNCFKPWIYNFNLIVIYRYTCTHFLFRMKTKCIIYIVFRLFESLKLYKIHKIHINKTLKALSNSKNKSLPILSFLVQFFQFVNNFLCLHVLPVYLVRIPNPTKNIRSGEGGGVNYGGDKRVLYLFSFLSRKMNFNWVFIWEYPPVPG